MRQTEGSESYPPYNIEKIDDDSYRITVAVAGFSEDDIEIISHDDTLVIEGRIETDETAEEKTFLHRGIAGRAFKRTFQLADHIKVSGASLVNGLLNVELVREVPEELKPRKIEIKSGGKKLLGKAA